MLQVLFRDKRATFYFGVPEAGRQKWPQFVYHLKFRGWRIQETIGYQPTEMMPFKRKKPFAFRFTGFAKILNDILKKRLKQTVLKTTRGTRGKTIAEPDFFLSGRFQVWAPAEWQRHPQAAWDKTSDGVRRHLLLAVLWGQLSLNLI